MNWAKIAEIALTCIASVGGIGAIVVWVIKSVSDTIADRLSKKYQLQLDKEKERYKTELSKKEYVSKTRFDTEFTIYRELTAAFSQLITDISILIPAGYVEVPADEKDRQKADQKHYTEANNSAVKAQNALYSNEAFIPKRFCDAYQEFLKLSRLQLFAYTRRFNITYHGEDNRFEVAIKVSANNYGYNAERKLLTVPFYMFFLVADDLSKGTLTVE